MASNDYLLRYIETLSRALASFVLGRPAGIHEFMDEEAQVYGDDFLRYRLQKLLLENNLNEAENLLFETIEADPQMNYLPVALGFYEQLSEKTDEELAQNDFSRPEIAEGLEHLKTIYGLE